MPFDLKDVKQLVELMRRSDLTEFELEQEGVKVRIKRDATTGTVAPMMVTQPPFPVHHAPMMAPSPAPVALAPAAQATSAANGTPEAGIAYVKSPMVGTFYRSPSPDSSAFVEVGATVKEESVVCIIEAMKVMNEIQAEVKGTIVEMLVENGASVEYGQPLYKVRLS